jgi:hypothetical protein
MLFFRLRIGMEHLGEGGVFVAVGRAVGLGQLGAQRRDRRRERRVLPRQTGRTFLALGHVQPARGEGCDVTPEGHG